MTSFRPRTLPEYVQSLWRRKLLLFLVTAAMLTATFMVIASLPDTYQSKASVVIVGKQEDRQVIAGRVATINERIGSRSFLEPLIEKHNLYAVERARGGVESALARLREDIRVDTKYRGEIPEKLTISYRNHNPEIASAVAADLVSTVGKMNEAMQQSTIEEAATIEAEMGQIETRLDELSQRRAASAVRSRAASYQRSAASTLRAQRAAAASSAQSLEDRKYLLEQQIAQQKQAIAEQKRIIEAAPPDTRAGSSYGVLLVRKAEIEAQIRDYSSQYTDKNPKLIQARTQLEEINGQIAELESGKGASQNSAEARELRALERDMGKLETELEITRRELARKQETLTSTPNVGVASMAMPVTDSAIGNISTEMDEDRLRDRYNSLTRRLDSIENMSLTTAGLDPGLFQIVDAPTQPEKPAGPDRVKLRLLALALALAAGFVVVAFVEGPKLFKIHDSRDVRYYLNAPVIALIPETVTPAERWRNRRLLLVRWLAISLLAVASVPAIIFMLNQLNVFQMLASRW